VRENENLNKCIMKEGGIAKTDYTRWIDFLDAMYESLRAR
jgi:hypothetical protein